MRKYLGERILTYCYVPRHEAHRMHVYLHKEGIRHIWWRTRKADKNIPRGCVRVNILGGRNFSNATDFMKQYEQKRRAGRLFPPPRTPETGV